MAPLSLKIISDGGAVTRKVRLEPTLTVLEATNIVKEKALLPPDAKPHGLFLRSLDNDLAGIWLEDDRTLAHYLLRDGDKLDFMCKIRNLRLRMLDGAVKTLQVDQSRIVGDLMISICSKLAITNHEEYGLCFDPDEMSDENKVGNTGTLTTKKKSQLRDRDIEFEQLSKKLKTDDNVEWIDLHKTLSEACIDPSRTLLLKRRLYYSDRKVDSRDPVQLNLLYVQARDNILTTRHPVTEGKAAEFAGIQCHIQFGDFNEEKHKPGLIENLNEYLPEQYCSAWGMEKKVFKEWSKHVHSSELEAKNLYIKTARALPTYGVTFFLVKEVQKGKKKLIHRLLGINAQAILRLDENTKEIIQEWPLTHVKTYSAGKGNSFTLNFGDYTDEEYSVKTRDAFRIRDILESYIDLIRKRMMEPYNHTMDETGYICQDNIGAATASTITMVSNNQMKVMEQSFVGPSKIVEYESGQTASSGTQIMTAQQIITSNMIAKQGQGLQGEKPVKEELNRQASCRLKRMNSKSVKVVTFLTEPIESNIEEARKLVEEMKTDLPFVKQGIQKTAENQTEENRKKLEDQMRELEELMKLLDQTTVPGHVNPSEAEAAAIKIAESSTKMYLSLDPGTQRRSLIIKRQRDSFIADERTEKTLRHASYIAASGSIDLVLNNVQAVLSQDYNGPAVDEKRALELEKSALDKIGKINAAIAHHYLAHSDPNNIDYAAAINSLHTIQELMPELAKDAQALASIKDGKSRQELLDSIRELSEASKAACKLNGRDHNKENDKEVIDNYTKAGGKLLFILGKGKKPLEEKENQVAALVREVHKQSLALVKSAQELSSEVSPEPGILLYGAATKVLDDSAALCRQTEITAPTISEPHCQSALTAASEALSSSVQHLATVWTPLVEDRKVIGDKLHKNTMDLAHALDKLTAACNLGCEGDAEMQDVKLSPEEQKLKFIHTLGNFQKNYDAAFEEVNKPVALAKDAADVKQAELSVSEKLGQLNAAIATLAQIYADPNIDYAAAESVISTINELMPLIGRDAKTSCVNKDPQHQSDIMEQLKELYKALAHLGDGPDSFTNEDALKFADSSGKLYYTIGRRINPQREDLIMDLATDACNHTSVLLAGVQGIAEEMGGDLGGELDDKGADLADAAQRLISTAQITAPSVSHPHSKSYLLSAIDDVSKSAQILGTACDLSASDPKYKDRIQEANDKLKLLEEQLEKLREACNIPDLEMQETIENPQEVQKLTFIKTMQEAQDKFGAAEKELDMPAISLKDSDSVDTARRLQERLSLLRRAIDALHNATNDIDKPDYMQAQQAMTTITELMPLIVQDTKMVSSSKHEPSSRDKMLAQIRELCRATDMLCRTANDPQNFKQAVLRCSDASNRLKFLISPTNKEGSRQQMVEMVHFAKKKADAIKDEVAKIESSVGAKKASDLQKKGKELQLAVEDMLITVQDSQSSFDLQPHLSRVSYATSSLQRDVDSDVTLQSPELLRHLKDIQTVVEDIRCCTDDAPDLPKSPPPLVTSKQEMVPIKPATKTKPEVPSKNKPDVPTRVAQAIPHKSNIIHSTEKFLQNLRCEESRGHPAHVTSETQNKTEASKSLVEVPALTEEEIQAHEEFVRVVENAAEDIRRQEKVLAQLSKSDVIMEGAMSNTTLMQQEEQLQKNLALAGVEVANLVAASYVDKMDYEAASKSSTKLSELMARIAENGKNISNNLDDATRKAFLKDVLQVCEASRNICDAATTDRKKLNEAAVEFGDKSAKLLNLVSSGANPSLEKEIISRAKAIGNSASRLASNTSTLVTSASDDVTRDVCDAATDCVHSAGKLLYTARVVAPMLHEPCSQEALISSTDSLSAKLQQFQDSCQKLTDPHDLASEADVLAKLLDELKTDVRGGRLLKMREVEQLEVENTPLRELTVKILDGAKAYTELPDISTPLKVEYASYSDRLGKALRSLDLANARCKKTPHDTNKRRELENAIQNLQMILLQSRPSRGEKGNSNIVDLRDFIEEVSSEAKALTAAAYDIDVNNEHDDRILGVIKEKCGSIETKAQQLMNYDDILEIDQLGQECDDLIKEIDKDIQGIQDAKAKRLLLSKILPLTESTHMLRFATKSSISGTESASLDSWLDDLDDIESRVIPSIVEQSNQEQVALRPKHQRNSSSSSSPVITAATNLCGELTSPAGITRGTLTAYIAAARPGDNKSSRHVYKLVHLIKALAVSRSRHSAVWLPVDTPLAAQITEQIVQELQSNLDSGSEVKDIAKLLIPSAPKIFSDRDQQEESLQTLADKLSSLCGELKPGKEPVTKKSMQEFNQRATEVVAAAEELDAVARGFEQLHPLQKKEIDEAAKAMKFEAYNVLQIAENAAKDPLNKNISGRLSAACERLNAAINRLTRRSSSQPALKQSCAMTSRDVTLRHKHVTPRAAPQPYEHLSNALQQQKENIYKLKNDEQLSSETLTREVEELGVAVRKSTDLAENCAYYISISDNHKDLARIGLVDVPQLQKSIESIQDSCMAIIGASDVVQAKEEREDLHTRVQQFSWSLEKAQAMVKDEEVKITLARTKNAVCDAAQDMEENLKAGRDLATMTNKAVLLLQVVSSAHSTIEQCPLVPTADVISPTTKGRCDDVIEHSKTLLSHTMELLKEVKAAPQHENMSWKNFPKRSKVINSYDALVKIVKVNGHRSGILLENPEENPEEEVKKSYLETQVDLANRWLKSPNSKAEVKAVGQQATRNIVDLAREMSEDLTGVDKEENLNLITETEELLLQSSKAYNQQNNVTLMDRIKELKKSIERGVTTRVVEDFMLVDDPLEDLDVLADSETDANERAFILERKIASLLAQLGRVTRTARFVRNTNTGNSDLDDELAHCTEQTELLAPMLVKAAQQRIDHPDDKEVVENYKSLLSQYAEGLTRVRNLCDRSVNPMDFVQAAGDTMQRMREDMAHNNDPLKGHYTSAAINRLANRVIFVGRSSPVVQRDPTLGKELAALEVTLKSATPAPDTRISKLPDWKESTAQVIRMTGDVESVLGGENIFKQQPTTANQPIYSVARDLHECVREWSSRDNEIVMRARTMAVLMAKLSEYMETDEKQALIATSKSIVTESQEVAELAKKLAHECTDIRIKTNLLQLVDRIPTISGQLKMLITVKGSSLGQQGNFEDKEAMDMLVVNAQSLMMSIQEVVKAAAGASVKIMSQRGLKLRWVRKNYY